MTDPQLTKASRVALGLRPTMKDLGAIIKRCLPEGADFGLFVVVEGEGDEPGHTVAVATRKAVIHRAVGEWVISNRPAEETKS